MTAFADQPLEDQIAAWRIYLRRRMALHGPALEELEKHLCHQRAALTEAGLAGDEAFLVALRRVSRLDALSREFARAHSERLWPQSVCGRHDSVNAAPAETLVVLSLAVAAAIAVKAPSLFNHPI